MHKNYVIGVDMGGTNTVFGIVNRRGDIIDQDQIKIRDFSTAADFVAELGKRILEMVKSNNAEGEIDGIGVGAPCANYFTGEIEVATDLPWPSPIPLGRMISNATSLPVKLSNDANTAAIGEMSYGAARGMRDFIVITLGTGVGSGIVCGGQLLNGHRGFGGELGHVRVWRNEHRECGCGRVDCLQTYCSAKGVVSTARMLLSDGRESVLRSIPDDELSAKSIADAAIAGDPTAAETYRITGRFSERPAPISPHSVIRRQ